jgi:UDP-N-acetylmuramoylalanine--D-glutamate ligase
MAVTSQRALVFGLGIAGTAVARALAARGAKLVLVDDTSRPEHEALARELRAELHIAPDLGTLSGLVKGVDLVLPAPGIPESHPVFAVVADAQCEMMSEIELAYRWEQDRAEGPRPMVAITGTDGKTTTTLLAAAMIRASGRKVAAVGNTETPLIAALDSDAEVFVVECSSFRLALTRDFRAEAGVWLNLAPDHLDWHVDMDSYTSAKSRLWSASRSTDVAVAPSSNPMILERARKSAARVVSFGAAPSDDYRVSGDDLVGPKGSFGKVSAMRRSLPHDVTNALAASAAVLESGVATIAGVTQALAEFTPSHHRIEFVAQADGVAWYDDSKATSPHAAGTALRAFPSIVYIAGGRNKGLDLGQLREHAGNVKSVIGIGESGPDIADVFEGVCPVTVAASMQEAVEAARARATAGDVVLLSPACTSFDWYRNYEERGRDFATRVRRLLNIDDREADPHP